MQQFSLRAAFINLNHARAANDQLCHDLIGNNIDIAGVNEPYYTKNGIVGFPSICDIFAHDDNPRAAIIIHNSRIKVVPLAVNKDDIILSIHWNEVDFLVYCTYCPPSTPISDKITDLENVLVKYDNHKIIICGDFNAKSELWGENKMDSRGHELINLILKYNIHILNDPHSKPTYCSTIGNSWIDIIMSINCGNWLSGFEVMDNISTSEHNLIEFNITINSLNKRRNHNIQHDIMDYWKLKVNMKERTSNIDMDVEEINDMSSFIDGINHKLRKLKNKCKKNNKYIIKNAPWWNSDLQTMRSKVRSLRRKFQKEENGVIRNKYMLEFKKQRTVYKRNILNAKKITFKAYLERVTTSNVFRSAYKMVRIYNKANVISTIIRNDGTTTTVYKDSRKAIMEHHFQYENIGEIHFNNNNMDHRYNPYQ